RRPRRRRETTRGGSRTRGRDSGGRSSRVQPKSEREELVADVFLQRTGAMDDGDAGEVVGLRRRGRRPLEGVGLPRVIAGDPPVLKNDAREEVEEEYGDRDPDDVRADRRDEVE